MIDGGRRLAPPPGCPLEMYRLMIKCWCVYTATQYVACTVCVCWCRNADKAGRPQFREIVVALSQSEEILLHIPEEVTRDHPQASVLGAPLEAGRNLYIELQNTYLMQ